MKMLLVVLLIVSGNNIFAQSLGKMPDSVRKIVDEYTGVSKTVNPPANIILSEDQIKTKFISLALKNAQITAADANVNIAEIARKKASSSMLSSINLGGNVNEFVINNSPQANFYPKFNLGVTIPLDIVSKNKAEKKTADQMIIISNAQRDQIVANIRARVLVQYEIYKERKEQVELQKIAMEDDLAAYERAQKDFKEDAITLEELNKIYKASIAEKSFLAAKERDLNVAIIQMEELIGVPLQTALQK
jgi:outer membrane protein TolC